jgi:hypothetical protein
VRTTELVIVFMDREAANRRLRRYNDGKMEAYAGRCAYICDASDRATMHTDMPVVVHPQSRAGGSLVPETAAKGKCVYFPRLGPKPVGAPGRYFKRLQRQGTLDKESISAS